LLDVDVNGTTLKMFIQDICLEFIGVEVEDELETADGVVLELQH
jgi:hypothetical protein